MEQLFQCDETKSSSAPERGNRVAGLFVAPQPADQPSYFANPEYQRRGADDDPPVFPGEGNYAEHFAAKRYDQVLADQDEYGHEQEAFTLF